MNYCRACKQDFGSVSAFDKHRTGTHAYTFPEGLHREPPDYDGRRCLETHELQAAGWTTGKDGRWRTPGAGRWP